MDIHGVRKNLSLPTAQLLPLQLRRPTQRLWTDDVGQSAQEEVDVIRGCANYGWSIYEGTRSNINPNNRPLSDFQAPVYTYPRDIGRGVTGGVVYRGRDFAELRRRNIYRDFITCRIWAGHCPRNRTES